MKRHAAAFVAVLAAATLVCLPLLPIACSPARPTASPSPVTRSDAPIHGSVRSYGWSRPAEAPAAETRYRLKMAPSAVGLPPHVDLRPKDVPIYNQGQLGSCTGNGWAALIEYRDKQLAAVGSPVPGVPPPGYYAPSRMFIYYFERYLRGTVGRDVGAAVADGAQVVSRWGTPPESDWPYNPAWFAVRPSRKAITDASRHVAPPPSSVDNTDLDEVRSALANGHPVVFGFNVYKSFESVGPTGEYVPAGRYVGGHCVVAVGYDDRAQVAIVRNSWGTDWGAKGYFFMRYLDFASPMCGDAWTLAN